MLCFIYSASGLVWSGRGEEGVPLQGKWMRCLYCNPQAEIVAAVCSQPSERGWSALLQPPPSFCWGFLSFPRSAGDNVLFSADLRWVGMPRLWWKHKFLHWPTALADCRLSPPSSWDMVEAPTSLPWLWYSVVPMSANLIIPLKHELSFTFPTFPLPHLYPHHSKHVNFLSSSEETFQEQWPSGLQ